MSILRIFALGPEDIQRLRALNALFASAFEDPETYSGALPSDAWLRGLLQRNSFFAVAAEDVCKRFLAPTFPVFA